MDSITPILQMRKPSPCRATSPFGDEVHSSSNDLKAWMRCIQLSQIHIFSKRKTMLSSLDPELLQN